MLDAARLAQPVGEGILWHPSSLDDIYAIPARTLILFDYYQLGMASRLQPWSWWRLKGKRATTHQYQVDWQFQPQRPARCGYKTKDELEQSETTKCSRCEKLDAGETTEATGTVAGVRVGAQSQGPQQGHAQ